MIKRKGDLVSREGGRKGVGWCSRKRRTRQWRWKKGGGEKGAVENESAYWRNTLDVGCSHLVADGRTEDESTSPLAAHFGGWWRFNVRTYGGKDKGSAQQWHRQDIPVIHQDHRDQQNMLSKHTLRHATVFGSGRNRRCVAIDSCQTQLPTQPVWKLSLTSRSRESPADTYERPNSAEFYQTKLPPDLYWDLHNGSRGPGRPVKNQQQAETLITKLSNILQTEDQRHYTWAYTTERHR